MKINKRDEQILEILRDRQFASVRFLAANLYTSPSSVRRSLTKMQSMGLVRRSYGGAILSENDRKPTVPDIRKEHHKAEKQAIAKDASSFIYAGMTLFIDSSTTCSYLSEHIAKIPDITVFTTNIALALELSELGVSIYCIGGKMSGDSLGTSGAYAEAMIRDIYADAVFFSAQALSEDGVISEASAEEASIKKAMLASARKKYFLCDDSKTGRSAVHRICTLDDVDEFVTGKK